METTGDRAATPILHYHARENARATRGGKMLARSTRVEVTTLLLLGFAWGFAFMDRMAMTFLSPYVVADLHLSYTQTGALGSALSITWALGAYIIGRWSDSTGRRKPFLLTALVVFSVCSVISGLAGNFTTLVTARAVMGAVEGPFVPICLAIITAVTPLQRRGLNAGIVQNVGGSLLGNALAPVLLVNVLAAHFGWRSSFYLAGVPGLILALLIWRLVPEPVREPAAGDQEPRASALSMLSNPNIALCAGISCMMVGSMMTGAIFLPLYFTKAEGLPPTTMSWIMAVLGVCPAVGGVLVPWLSDRIGRRTPMIIFCALMALCPLAALYVHGNLILTTALMFVGWTGAGTFPLFMGVVPAETLGFRNAATAMGLIVAVGELTGGFLSPLIGGRLADHYSLTAPLLLQAALPFVGMALAFGLRETNPRAIQSVAAPLQREIAP
jgi:predicted MFS family arabinose efflux permease